ncbi:MAG: YfhO family protein [Bacteroidia bacterium]|nr:YfhO family protein [Bacteroidia bacterium]
MQKKRLSELILPPFLLALFGILYFFPYYQGYRFKASDQIQLIYMGYHVYKVYQETGELPFWAPNLFGGMPSYLVHYVPEGIYFLAPFMWLEWLFRAYPPMIFFIGALGFFLFLRIEGLSWSWAMAGALGFVLTSYYTNMIVATHWGKSNVLFSVPYVLAGMSLLRRQLWGWGVLLSLLGWAGIAGGNHPQMAYYALTLIGGYAIVWAWESWQNRQWKSFATGTGLLAIAAVAGTLSQASSLLPYYEYGRYSIRGGSELERDTNRDPSLQSGLDKEYAQSYSANRAELWTLVIPDFVGGTSHEDIIGRLGRNSALVEALRERGIGDVGFLRAMPTYWGGSPFSAGSFYVSAIAFFLMILGWTYGLNAWDWTLAYIGWLVLQLALGAYGYSLWATPILLLLPVAAYYAARPQKKLYIRAGVASAVFLGGWGVLSLIDDHPDSAYKLTDWALEYLPFYNKFRAPSTWLVLMGFILPWAAMRGVLRFLEQPKRENLFTAVGLSAVIILLIGIGGSMWGFSFESPGDATLKAQAQLPDWFMEALREDRIAIARQSALRSLFWVMATGGLLWLFLAGQLRASLVGGLSAMLFAADGWLLNSAYFPKRETYMRNRELPNPPPPLPHEEVILRDTSWYRILPLHTSAFTDARPSVYFENAGGYHPAKLKRYQQFIETHLSQMQPEALRMLAIRYITAKAGTPPPPNYDSLAQTPDEVVIFRAKDSLPMAWLVEQVKIFPRTDQTLDSLGRYLVHRVAMVAQKDWERLKLRPTDAPLDTGERVVCLRRSPNELIYKVTARQPRLLVLSEVYYPKDWKAVVNDKLTPIIPANYILRALVVPPGESTVRLYIESDIHLLGRNLSLTGSVVAWGLVIVSFLWMIRRPDKPRTHLPTPNPAS